MPLIGYARVSTEDQTPLPQSQALKSAGCAEIHEEQASGGNRARPVLARVLERIGKGDTLVVVRIDRLARSLSHLLEVIERLEAKGAFFRSHSGPDRHVLPAGQVHAAGPGRRGRVRARPDPGTHQGRAGQRTHQGPGWREPGPARQRSGGAAQGAAGATGRLHGAPERDGTGLGAPCAPVAPRLGLGRRGAHHQRPPARGASLDAKPSLARCERLCPRRLPARRRCWTAPGAAKPTTACPPSSPPSRARTPTSRFRRSAPGWKRCASARPAGGQAGSRHR